MLVEGRHFRLDWSTPHDVGRKAIAQNAADIEAMGGAARRLSWSAFGAPAGHPGAAGSPNWPTGCGTRPPAAGGAGIVGGDLVRSPQWVVSVTVLGDLDGRPGRARAAVPGAGRLVAVAGELGRSAAGYALLTAGVGGFRRTAPPSPGARTALRSGRRAADAGCDGDDRRLRRSDRRPAPHRDGLGRRNRPVDAAGWPPTGTRWPRPRRSWVWTRGRGCSAAARTTRWSPASPVRLPAGWRVIGTVVDGAPGVRVDGADWTGYAGWESFN